MNIDNHPVNVLKERDLDQRSEEYEEFKKRETRFATKEQFLDFCKDHFVYYAPDFGSYIQSLITTDRQFIKYIQRVCIDDWFEESGGLMWFVNEGPDNPYVTFNQEINDEDLVDEEGNIYHTPTVTVESYRADYNQFYDDPFSVVKDVPEFEKNIFAHGTLVVKPEISAKMPFIARFVSHDTFDRLGSIKGNSLEIIPISNLTPGEIMFI